MDSIAETHGANASPCWGNNVLELSWASMRLYFVGKQSWICPIVSRLRDQIKGKYIVDTCRLQKALEFLTVSRMGFIPSSRRAGITWASDEPRVFWKSFTTVFAASNPYRESKDGNVQLWAGFEMLQLDLSKTSTTHCWRASLMTLATFETVRA